jgi:hypothetical protein
MGDIYRTHRKDEKCIEIFSQKPLGRPRRTFEDNI